MYPEFIIQAARNTESASLSYCSITAVGKVGPDLIDLLATDWFKAVTTFHISEDIIDDSDADAFINGLPSLQRLKIENNDYISDDFLKDLIIAPLSKIKEIHLKSVRISRMKWTRGRGDMALS